MHTCIALTHCRYAYVFVERKFNGDPEADAVDSLSMLTDIAPVLLPSRQASNLLSITAVIEDIVQRILSSPISAPRVLLLSLIQDTAKLMKSNIYVLRALSHCHRLCEIAIQQATEQKFSRQQISMFKMIQKKLYFLAVWWHEQTDDVSTELSEQLLAEYERLLHENEAPSEAPSNRFVKAEPKIEVLDGLPSV